VAKSTPINVSIRGDYNDKDINRAINDLKRLEASGKTMSAKMGAVGASMADVGKKMTLGLTLPIVGVGVAATKMFMDFETSMSKITALVGLSTAEVAGMEKGVLKLSGQTGKSAGELADALFVVTSAGLRGSDAMNALESAAKAGAAGLGETNDIARAVAGSVNAYGSSVLDAATATDVIVATARAGNFETSQFAAALGRVLPFSKQVGASLQDTGGAVALLTRTNGNAAQSVTQLSALMRAFVVPTEQTNKVLQQAGLSAEDMRKAIADKGLPDFMAAIFDNLRRINNILIDMGRDIWTYISMDYFGQRVKKNEVGSSTMPHKVNPIDFENAEGNFMLANSLFDFLSNKLPISRMQRDLTDSTVSRNIGVPMAHTFLALKSLKTGLGKLTLNQDQLASDLSNNFVVVAEAVQTILRRENFPAPYEALKAFTRGKKKITKGDLIDFINSLDIKEDLKEELKDLKPETYLGVTQNMTQLK